MTSSSSGCSIYISHWSGFTTDAWRRVEAALDAAGFETTITSALNPMRLEVELKEAVGALELRARLIRLAQELLVEFRGKVGLEALQGHQLLLQLATFGQTMGGTVAEKDEARSGERAQA